MQTWRNPACRFPGAVRGSAALPGRTRAAAGSALLPSAGVPWGSTGTGEGGLFSTSFCKERDSNSCSVSDEQDRARLPAQAHEPLLPDPRHRAVPPQSKRPFCHPRALRKGAAGSNSSHSPRCQLNTQRNGKYCICKRGEGKELISNHCWMADCLPRHTHPAEDGATARETGTSEDRFDGPLISVAALLLPPQCIACQVPQLRDHSVVWPSPHCPFALMPEEKCHATS